jgi:uncharacterized Ntn-hydrolase superfamily protein
MTFSIVARGADGECWGVAAAAKFLAVGSAVPAAAAGVGAIATQAYANLGYRHDGLRLLRAGGEAEEVVRTLVAGDPDSGRRQVGVVDAAGRSRVHTGTGCQPWAGGRAGPDYAVAGNVLAGPQVVEAMVAAWTAGGPRSGSGSGPAEGAGGTLAERLLAVLRAGEAAGGDRRGRQSASMLVVCPGGRFGGADDVLVDLRVDDHPEPVDELARLLALNELHFGSPDPAALLPLEGELATEVRDLLAERGYRETELAESLTRWATIENFDARLVPGRLDPLILDQLRSPTAI